ncbi:aromatic acid exporter family protein [Geomicrobium sp. JCM 19039]|uniref:aromatic acid exporter family protein n=1 Tax=Geomicrobium sp. JCM 19039 TaxID=1460636 RepID=UPI0006932F06|nr:aromatic acid exporter family protein [Geomicrobium sp. JCM 19039]
MLHIYTVGTVSFTILWNEFLLIVIGVTVGLIMNLYMPSLDDDIYEDQIQLEEYFERILKEYSKYLYNKDDDWDGKELTLRGI